MGEHQHEPALLSGHSSLDPARHLSLQAPLIFARIQAHPSRSHLHDALASALEFPSEIVLHASTPPSPWDGYKACLKEPPANGHLLVIQDDATVCKNFAPALRRIAEANPDTPVVLFLSKFPPRISNLTLRAGKKRESYVRTWLRINEFLPVVAVLWPRHKAIEFMEWAATAKLPGYPRVTLSDDACAGRWASLTKQTIAFTIPSLVEHDNGIPSLVGNNQKGGRVALSFCKGDPLEIDWS